MAKFKPGQSGNPGGRPKDELRPLARKHTSEAIKTLLEVMRSRKTAAAARVTAATALLDRGWGRPVQGMAFTDSDGNDRELPGDGLSELDRARRVAFLLARGLELQNAAGSQETEPRSEDQPHAREDP